MMSARSKAGKVAVAALILVSLIGMSSAAVQSADLLKYESNNDFFSGPVMNIYFGDNGATDKIDVEWSESELEQKTGKNVQNGVSIDVTHSNTKAVYSFRRPGLEDIYEWETVKGQVDVSSFDSEQQIEDKVLNSDMAGKCADLDGSGDFSTGDAVFEGGFDGFNFVQYVYCVKKGQKLGNVGEIDSNPRTVTSTTFKVENTNGKVEKATITNGEKGDGVEKRIGPHTHVVFAGQDSAGRQPPVSTDELIMHSNGYTYYDIVSGKMVTINDGWKVIDRNKYNDYKDAQGQIYSKLETWASSGEQYRDDVVSGINHQANLATDWHPDTEFDDATFNDASSIENGKMEISSDELAFAQFNLYVNVCEDTDLANCDAMVNIEKTTGEPQINSVSSKKFKELESGEITVQYQNVGDAEGTFSARVKQCSSNFEFTGVSQRETLEAGETHTASFPISFSTTSKENVELTGECTVEVTETSTDVSVTSNVDVKAEQVSECTPGEQFKQTRTFQLSDGTTVQRDVVLECVSKTGETKVAKQCGQGEVAKANSEGYQCVTKTSGGDGTTGGDDDKKSDCTATLVKNPMGADLTAPDPVCQFNKAFGGIYGMFKLFGSFMLGAFLFGMRGTVGKIMSLEPTQTLSVFGRSIKARYILGIFMFIVGFYLGLNIMSNPIVKWGITIATVIAGAIKLYLEGPIGLVSWIFPTRR